MSDAGTPLVSDPGWKLVHEAVAAEIKVWLVPGASALLAGLVTSGLPTDRFLFAGFLPPKANARRNAIEALKRVAATLVFYESGPRLADALADLAAVLGPRDAAIARELSKLFEETRCGSLTDLAARYAAEGAPKGEIVVRVGPPAVEIASSADLDAALRVMLAEMPTKVTADSVAEALGPPRRNAYQRAFQLKAIHGQA